MAGDALKTPFGRRANELALKRAGDAIQLEGKALPCSVVSGNGTFVIVKFEIQSIYTLPQVRVPVASSEYFRMPIQPGCKGVVIPADDYIGGVSGLGGGVAKLTRQANLANLVFVPIGTTAFPSVPDGFAVIYGPTGVIIRDQNSGTVVTITGSGITIQLSGGNVTVSGGDVIAEGISLRHHRHGGVQAGSGQTGEPVA